MRTRTETIRELPNGWLNKHTGHTHKTAVGAYRSAMSRNKKIAAQLGATALILTWEPTTPSGRAIALSFS